MSPWLIIGFLIALITTGGVAYVKGGEDRQNALVAAQVNGQSAAIRTFNAYALEDVEAARQAGERAGRQALKAQKIQHDLEMEALHGTLLTLQTKPGEAPQPAGPVRISPAGMRVLNAAIDHYNACAAAAPGCADEMPADRPPGGGERPGGRGTAQAGGSPLRLSLALRGDAR